MMGQFALNAGGQIGIYTHPKEYETHVPAGDIVLIGAERAELIARTGDFVYVPTKKPYGYANMGKKEVQVLRVIPEL